MLTISQITEYQENGYLLCSDFFTNDEKKIIMQAITEIEKWPEVKDKWMKYYEPNNQTGEKLLCRIENFVPYQNQLNDILTTGKIMDAMSELMSQPVFLYKDKINFKYPGGNGFMPHQDAPAFSKQGQQNHMTVLIAIDAATLENGCLEFVTNNQHIWKNKILLQHDNKGSLTNIEGFEWKPIKLNPGDVVFFGSYIPHRSGPNLSQQSRRILYMTYNPTSEGNKHDDYYNDKRKCFPPDFEREENKDYSDGERIYNLANPIVSFK